MLPAGRQRAAGRQQRRLDGHWRYWPEAGGGSIALGGFHDLVSVNYGSIAQYGGAGQHDACLPHSGTGSNLTGTGNTAITALGAGGTCCNSLVY